MSKRFEKQVAVVTGGASGIGAAIARELAAGGARVMVADRDGNLLKDVVHEIKANGGEAAAFEIDVAVAGEVEAMIEHTERAFGGLDLAVNNAGIGGVGMPTGEYTLEGWQQVIDVNLSGVFYCMRYELPAMVRRGGGAIVNMASILGSVAFATAPAYVAAKHGVVGLTKTAAIEYADKNIRINSVGPGFIDTPLLSKHLDAETLKAIAAMHPIGRLGTSEEVSALTCFLLSKEAGFITGSYHLVDGGYVAK
ncbi:SDR family NAD(P)-dependent oxidoreductase [Devosia nitrariae]|uniref:2,5-dichloro-2,5-cyclohexadiene-1,4-diol dehydrogenase n=1 Tax=Devosia nitrariae TaxID=2071872 RepID=A0ABQ5WA24_9HYPH|nr:SDR family oxidoreductase [Devosia nitrariae]GLQ56636.1 2,5-dichloro-2,5-cyclohexadiene-1,4-diol dehydrogenase [Devosia nitrariae]